jgi:hypothetical protein
MSVAAPEHGTTVPAGDPQALRAAAGRLTAAAAMDGVAANLGAAAEAACGERSWVGPASLAFRRHVQETRQALRTGSRAFHDAAAALTRLAGELQAAQEEARRAQAAAAAAALEAATAAATVPRPPERAGACETTAEWLRRQAGDVFLDSLNPFAAEHDACRRGRILSDWTSGLLIGSYEQFHKYAAKGWVRHEPGYRAREPRMVRGYPRRTPSGGRTWVDPYLRPGKWVGAREVPDLAKRASSLRAAKGVIGTTSVAGAVVGAKVGAVRGAALGSAVPGVGTLAGGAVGALVGGVIGSGVGQAIGSKIKGWLF